MWKRRLPALALVAVGIALSSACSERAIDGAVAPAGTYPLDGDTSVVVTPTGGVRLQSGGRTVFALSDTARIIGATYTEHVQGLTAIWSFERDMEERAPVGDLERVAREGSEVVLTFRGGASVRFAPQRAGASRVRITVPGTVNSIAVPLACDPEATFYGFGEQYDSPEHRGHAFPLLVSEQGIGRQPDHPPGIAGDAHTTYFPMPYFFDARGFGLLAKTAYRTLVDLCKTDPNVAWMEVESGEPVDLVVFHGPTPLDVIRQLGDEVGRPRLPPPWAFSTWIGAQGGRDAVLARVARVEAAKIPATAIWVQDWTGIRRNIDGGYGVEYRWKEDAALYPDFAGMTRDLRARGFRFLSYANPFVVRGLDHFDAMAAGKMLLTKGDGNVYEHIAPNGAAATPDFSNPATAQYVGDAVRDMFLRLGHDGFMADFGEWAPLDARYQSGADPRAEHNLFPVRWQGALRAALDQLRPDGDYAMFARSGWTGVQAVAQIYWVGDQEADFSPYDGLPTVQTAMMSLGFAGVPFVTHDVAGFSNGPSTKELYMRWTELGAFSPILRTHDGNRKLENWAWDRDEETTLHFARMSAVHRRLEPELQAAAARAAETSAPLVRHLVLDYAADPESRATHDEYLLGEQLLVAPVVTAGATSRAVYFPPGHDWYHVFTGAKYAGGSRADVSAPIGTPAVFSRDADRTDLRAP